MARKKRKQSPDVPVEIINYFWKGIACSRRKPLHVKNPRSAGQMNHRNRIGLASRFVKACKKFIKIGYQDTDMDNSFNEARKYLYDKCFTDSPDGNPKMIYSNILISRGKLAKPEEFHIKADGATAEVTWKKPVKGDSTNGDDYLMVLMFSDEGEGGLELHHRNIARRKDGSATFSMLRSNKPVHLWAFFHNSAAYFNESKSNISDSVYLELMQQN